VKSNDLTEQSGGNKVPATLKCGLVCLFLFKGVHALNYYYLHRSNTYISSASEVSLSPTIEGSACIWTPRSTAALLCQHYLQSLSATYFGYKEYWL